MHFVYILRSAHDDGLYIGYSANLRRRFMQHCEGTACATAHRRPWTLIYYEAYIDPADALGRERYLKSGAGRRFQKRNYRITCKTTHSKQPRERSLYAAMIYTHVLNRPGLGIRSPLDFDAPSTGC
jgi:putative endonuclease